MSKEILFAAWRNETLTMKADMKINSGCWKA